MMAIPEATQRFVEAQRKQAKGPQPSITCQCGWYQPIRFFYKCLYCKMWMCQRCAEVHFGKTVEQWHAENAKK